MLYQLHKLSILEAHSFTTILGQPEVGMKVISSFPKGSGEGPDGLLPHHLKALLHQPGTEVHLFYPPYSGPYILEGRNPPVIRSLIFGATSLTKKCRGVCLIVVGPKCP